MCPRCAQKNAPLEGDFAPTVLDRIWFGRGRSCFGYEGTLRDAIHVFKYEEGFHLLPFFVRELSEQCRFFEAIDVIVPIPLHVKRLAERGFNQSALLSTSVGTALDVPVDLHVLERKRHDPPQVGKEGRERLSSVRSAFAVAPKRRSTLNEKRVLLIDDVITTGATVNEGARALMKAGAKRVDVLSIARTL
ncbi:MAG: ComF family protein [Deltaproteobacteria bacterium]|nr:ComF family protein [Deltaproteobacteria bacterium]